MEEPFTFKQIKETIDNYELFFNVMPKKTRKISGLLCLRSTRLIKKEVLTCFP